MKFIKFLGTDKLHRAKHVCVICLFLFAALSITAPAQVQVDLSIKRNLYIVYEPILAKVTITNLSGNELDLIDEGYKKWFGLELTTSEERPIAPLETTYSNEPLQLGPGQKISRTINLTPLFPISEFGGYRLRAIVFVARENKYFYSRPLNFEITEGHLLWQKTVGVPGSNATRTVSLLAHRLPETNQLYIRIEDKETGTVYCTHQLGRLLAFATPDVLFDRQNQVHVLQNIAPKSFVYSHIGLNGEILERKSYSESSSRPKLLLGSDGHVLIMGGQLYDPSAPKPEQMLPSLSDRPVALPKPQKKPTPEDKRPTNLLSR